MKLWIKWLQISDFSRFVFLTLLICAAYANTLGNAFISDDIGISINAKNPAWVWSQIQFIRPLTYYLIYAVSGTTPLLYHAVNILSHIGVVILLYLLVVRMTNRTVAFISAVLFAVHPILTESITWISGGIYPQYSFFILLALLLYTQKLGNRNILPTSLAYAGALLSSEKAIVFPLMLVLYELLFGNIKRHWKTIAITSCLTIAFIVLSGFMVPERLTQLERTAGILPRWDNPLVHVATAITMYLQLIVWPRALSIYHSDPHMGVTETIMRVEILLGLLVTIVLSYRKHKQLCFWLSFFIISLLLTLSPYRITWIIAERYVYLGMAGIATAVALVLERISQYKKVKNITWIIIAIMVITLALRTIQRNGDWKSDDTFWLATTKASPTEPKAHNTLASIYAKYGNYTQVIKELETAIALRSDYAPAYYNLGLVYETLGQPEKAIDYYKQTLVHNPLEPHAQAALKRLGVTL